MRPVLLAALLNACTSAPSGPSPTPDTTPDADRCATAGQPCRCVSGAGILPGSLQCAGGELLCDCPLPDAGADAPPPSADDGPDDAAEVGDDAVVEAAVDALDAPAPDAPVFDAPSLDDPDAQAANADAACETRCDGACVDAGFDPFNCGGCGVRCAAPAPNTRAQCTGGRCVRPCVANYDNCNGDHADGCETFLAGNDRGNCGSCRFACNPIEVCVAGRCRVP